MALPVRIGLVGMGIHGMRYARHLQDDVPGAILSAVCRQDAVAGSRWARDRGILFFADYRELIAEQGVDGIVVVTSPGTTARVVLGALAAGKPVLVEKPLATSLEEARAVDAAAHRKGAVCMMAHTLRWNATIRALKDRIGELGRLQMLAFSQRLGSLERRWLDRPELGGVLFNTGVHAFDLLRHLSGQEVREVFCQCRRTASRRTPDAFVASMVLSGTALATVDNCRTTPARSGRVEVVGERGELAGDHIHGTLARIVGSRRELLPVPGAVPTVREVLRDFVKAAAGRQAVPVGSGEGLRALEIAVACRTSWRERRPVRMSELSGESGAVPHSPPA